MNRFRRGRPDTFTIISNAAIDEFDDVTTVGLLAKILRLPNDYRLTMDELAARLKGTSRKALYACMRSLVDKGYVVKVKYQDERGRWRTDTYSFDPPCTPAEAAAIDAQYVGLHRVIEPCWLDPAWIAEQGDSAPAQEEPPPPPYATRVSPARTGLPNRQAGPSRGNVEKPSSDRPAGNRPVGDRPVGNAQALSKTPNKTEEVTPSSSAPPDTSADQPPRARRRQEEPPAGKPRTTPAPSTLAAATGVLDALPTAVMKGVTVSQRRDVTRHLVPRLEAGWSPGALVAELSRDLGTAGKPVGVWIHRLGKLSDLPPAEPSPDDPGHRAEDSWCGQCTSPSYRFIERDADGTVLDNPVRCACHLSSGPRRRGTRDSYAETDRAAALTALADAYPECLTPHAEPASAGA